MIFKNLKLSGKPFSNTTDPSYYYMTDPARKAWYRIVQGIDQQAPCVVLSGDPGTGKTTLIQCLMASDNPTKRWLFINHTSLTWQELLLTIGRLLKTPGLTTKTNNPGSLIAARLKKIVEQQMLPVLILDEAQCLNRSVLKELFKWQDGLKAQAIGVTIILSGQTELPQILVDAMPLNFDTDNTIHCRLTRMNFDECRTMIAYRLKKAGYSGPALFSNRTLRTIFSLSGGIPRRMVTICDLAMFTAVAHTGQPVSPEDIRDISEYILRTVADKPEKNRSPKAVSTRPKLESPLELNAGGSAPLSIKESTWMQWLAHCQDTITGQWKYVSALGQKHMSVLQLASWPWKKTLVNLVKRAFIRRKPLLWPWGWTAVYLLIIIALGYAWLPSPTHTFSPTASVVVRIPIDQALAHNLETVPGPITTEVRPASQVSANNLEFPTTWDEFELPSPKQEEVIEKEIKIAEIMVVPQLLAYKDAIDKQTPPQTIALAKITEIISVPVSNDHRIHADTPPTPKQGFNHIETAVSLSDSKKKPAMQAAKPLPSPPVVERALVTVKKIEPAVQKKTNPASKHLASAIEDGHIDAVRIALSDGADPNAIISKNKSALTAAIERGKLEIVQILVDRGATINLPTPTGETALTKAAWKGHLALTEWLLNHGAQVNLQNREGWSPLFYASIRGQSDIADLLMEHEARLDLADRDGRTPLMAAAWNGHTNIVHRLLSEGANPNRKDRDGWTSLMFAAFGGHAEVGKLLLSTGADLSMKNNSKQTSADLATQQGHSDLYAMISNHSHP